MEKFVKKIAIIAAFAYLVLPDLFPGPIDDLLVFMMACNLSD